MNTVVLMGRLTKDPEITDTANSTSARFTLAVDRRGEGADFIQCKVFGKGAAFVEKYFSKGKKMALKGRLHTDSYVNREGKKVYTSEVIADDNGIEFADSKNSENTGFEIPEESELPFK